MADDHPILRSAVRSEIEEAGFEVCAEASDGPSAVAGAMRTCPDLCLLDVQMPGGGIEAAREIKQRLPDTKVVMLTAGEEDDDIVAAITAGASGYLGKDIEPARLPHVLEAVIRGELAIPRSFVSILVERLSAPSEPQTNPQNRRGTVTSRATTITQSADQTAKVERLAAE